MIDGIPNWPLYFLPKNTIDHRSPHFVCFHWDLRHAADMEIEILHGYPGFSEHIISPCICQIWVNTTASLKFSLYRWSFTHNKTVQKCYWLVVWYVFVQHIGNNNPNGLSYFHKVWNPQAGSCANMSDLLRATAREDMLVGSHAQSDLLHLPWNLRCWWMTSESSRVVATDRLIVVHGTRSNEKKWVMSVEIYWNLNWGWFSDTICGKFEDATKFRPRTYLQVLFPGSILQSQLLVRFATGFSQWYRVDGPIYQSRVNQPDESACSDVHKGRQKPREKIQT